MSSPTFLYDNFSFCSRLRVLRILQIPYATSVQQSASSHRYTDQRVLYVNKRSLQVPIVRALYVARNLIINCTVLPGSQSFVSSDRWCVLADLILLFRRVLGDLDLP